jgi:ParB family chromosome partitioning protein
MSTVQKVKRSDVFKVDPLSLKVEEGFNVRVDYGNIEELAASIAQRGVMVPLRGYRVKEENAEDTFVIVDGHRRFKAIQLAMELGAEISLVPIMLEPRGYSKEDRILDMFTLNDGKRLEPIEEGELFKRLKNLGWDEKELSQKTGRSLAHVYKMLEVVNSPKEVQNAVKEGSISANTVSQIIQTTKDEDAQKEMVKEAVASAKAQGKKKATAKHVKAVAKKNPITASEEALEMAEAEGVDNARMDMVQAFISLLKKKPTPEEILEFIKRG